MHNMGTTYATKQAATRLNVTATTVRNWSERYSAFLSESARPGYQPERRFTDKDLTILEYIKQLKEEGIRDNAVRERLAETTFQDVEVIEASATMPNVAQLGVPALVEAPQNEQKSLQPAPAPIMAQEYFQAIERRFEALEASAKATEQRRLSTLLVFLLGLTAGIVLIVGLLALATLYMK